ncbi:MAG: hypothetical protein M1827_005689 [Pycnora praestabilis]|nr:MAG: hypothetical protein M1827_005689 [Pycnora praestabilis]
MAKSARSSVKKFNKSKLRSRVFGPIEAARTERLSAKLLDLASKPRPLVTQDSKEEIEGQKQNDEIEPEGKQRTEAMDVDTGRGSELVSTKPKSKHSGRVQKKSRGKASASMVFPNYKKGRMTGGTKNQKT